MNWSVAKHGKRLLTLLKDLNVEARCSTAHNKNERHGIHQQGSVGMLILGELISYYKKGSKDFRNLGRWDSCILQAKQHHRTWLVQVYGVRPERSQKIGSVYQQHLRYIQTNLDYDVSPRDLFESDLVWQLQMWRASGDCIILMMDANCHVLMGRLSRSR